jgi:hypothetical protein
VVKIKNYEAHAVAPNVLLSTTFLDTLSLCSSLLLRGKVSHPYRIMCKIIVSYILIFMILGRRWEHTRF